MPWHTLWEMRLSIGSWVSGKLFVCLCLSARLKFRCRHLKGRWWNGQKIVEVCVKGCILGFEFDDSLEFFVFYEVVLFWNYRLAG
jgi:hypothetical protein